MYNLKNSENRQFPPRTTTPRGQVVNLLPCELAPELGPALDVGRLVAVRLRQCAASGWGHMIRERLLKDLANIERHLTRGEDAIARQEQIVAELEQLGLAGLDRRPSRCWRPFESSRTLTFAILVVSVARSSMRAWNPLTTALASEAKAASAHASGNISRA
jgi:hypothetical protein